MLALCAVIILLSFSEVRSKSIFPENKIFLNGSRLRFIRSSETRAPRNYGNPEEQGDLLEGDLMENRRRRNGLSSELYRWPRGEVPFEFSSRLSPSDVNLMQTAFNEYHKNTCVRFIPRNPQHQDYIFIDNSGSGCSSNVGRIGKRQVVNLESPKCMKTLGTPIHELGHVVGLLHEQNRDDRDEFVTIIKKNIISGTEKNFEKARPGESANFGVPYNYESVMHYSSIAFSKDQSSKTIEAKKAGAERMGQRDGFSRGDIEKIRKMYRC